MRRRDLLKAIPILATPALAQSNPKTLRFVPQANLSTLDPVWTTATVVINHAYMVYDTLYGIDAAGECHRQMCAGHEVAADELTWTSTLRGRRIAKKRNRLGRGAVDRPLPHAAEIAGRPGQG